jgi:hypothetical protein
MKTVLRTTVLFASMLATLMVDIEVQPGAPLRIEIGMVREAQAVLGRGRRSFRRGVVVGTAVANENEKQNESQQQQTTTQQQAAPATAPPPPTAQPAASGGALALGTVVQKLPAGCTSAPSGDVTYYHCGSNYYRAVFQGNNLVYVTAKP